MKSNRVWPKHKLGEVADLCLGKMLDKKKNRGELRPYLGNIHVRWGSFNLSDLPEMRFEEHEYERYGLKYGDLVVCEGGEPGRCALWKEQVAGMKIQKALHRVRVHECLDSQYLFYWFLRAAQRSYFDQFVTGATIKHLPGEKLARVEVEVPDLPTQKKIAGILSAYDDLIENNLRRIAILEEMAKSLYREWFVHFRFPGHETVKFVDSPMGEIPEGWEVKPCPEAVSIRPKVPVPKHDCIPFVPMGSLSGYSMLIGERESRIKASGARFQNGDTLFARITPCLENGKTGFVQFLPDDETVCCGSTEFIVLRSKTLCPEYVYLMARSDPFRDNAIKSMSGATGRQRVREECFEQFYIAQPSTELLDRFQEIVQSQFKLIHSLALRNQNLRTTRDLLLPKLLKWKS
jgi:type I restriction enzyme S subunit